MQSNVTAFFSADMANILDVGRRLFGKVVDLVAPGPKAAESAKRRIIIEETSSSSDEASTTSRSEPAFSFKIVTEPCGVVVGADTDREGRDAYMNSVHS